MINKLIELIIPSVIAPIVIILIGYRYFDTEKRKIKRDFIDNSRKLSGAYFGSCLQYLYALMGFKKKIYSRKEISDLFLGLQKPYADLILRFGKDTDYNHVKIYNIQKEINELNTTIINNGNLKTNIEDIVKSLENVHSAMGEIERSFYNEWKKVK
ncbi:hypothetical protein CI088_02000 [Enterococcus plantarum]|uniref:Uncharacterized protein n=2 Tax=Enterococcus plantarum TaxID=1077675 RepID=A0A2W3ZBJ0_9ENTE|nr:hypothetical protein CI088_02000 [Enterococcus plantarum]